MPTCTVRLGSSRSPLALQSLADVGLDHRPSMIDRPPGPSLDGDTELRIGVDGMDGSGDANSGVCARLWAMASYDLRQPLQVISGAHNVLAPNPPRRLRAGTAGSGRGRYEGTGPQSLRPPANRGGRRRTRDRREACRRWRAISRLDVTPSRGWAIDEVASAVAERPRSRGRLAPLCLHRRACAWSDKRTPQQRTAGRHLDQ
jgi:hypothetical protein